MTNSSLIRKLQIKPGYRILIINAPAGYVDELGPLPKGVELAQEPSGSFDFVHLYAKDSEELARYTPGALRALKTGGALWISYPKRSSKIETDLARDEGWEVVFNAGLRAVRQVSIDDVWSALRFGPASTDQQMLDAQYSGKKAALRPIYDRLAQIAQALGDDVELSPRKTYVALARKKQFGVIQASTNTRVDLGLRLTGKPASGRLVEAGGFGSGSITHKVALTTLDQVDDELVAWIQEAYQGVG